jgi:hypothetical protein
MILSRLISLSTIAGVVERAVDADQCLWPPSAYCDALVPDDRITVKVEHGIVTLRGRVDWHH